MGFRNGATMENLPDVLLSNISIRLLAKQLAQMRCVSKSWNALLSESSFIKSHLDRSIQNNNNDGILLVFSKLFSFASKPFTAHLYRSPHLPNSIKLPLNSLSQSNNSQGKVIGSVNGLICFEYGSNRYSEFIYGSNQDPDVIYIWNPSTSALLTLPPYHMPSHSFTKFFRFGFDPKTNDYKVVKISRHIEKRINVHVILKGWLQVEVYSMRKGSWKLITQEIPSHVTDLFDSEKLCLDGHNGHLHWIAEINHCWNSVDTILAFDLGAETFREIPLPVTRSIIFDNANDVLMYLVIFAGKLCVMSRALPDYECEVWVMDEYGVAESWVKLHDFPSFSGDDLYPYRFTSHSEFLIQVLGGGLALYDPAAAKTKIFKYHGERYWICKVVEYVDSLVWVTPAEQHQMNCCSISRFQF